MATVAGVKIKTKVAKKRDPLFFDEKYTGGEPQWPAEAKDWPEDKFDNLLRKSFYYYNYYYNQKQCKPYVVEWMQSTETWTKTDIKAFIRSTDKWLAMTACSLIMANRAGMPLRPRHVEFLTTCIRECIVKGQDLVDEDAATEAATTTKVEVYKPSIQDRLNEKTSELIGEIEGAFDDVTQKVKSNFKAYDFLVSHNVPQSQLGKYADVYTKRKQEYELAQSGDDKQLKEAYSHLKAADFKRIIGFLDEVLGAIEQYRGVKKAAKKARKPRAVSKEKLVAKLKYAKENKELKIISINPVDILGAKKLWVYNPKYRKLGCYIADDLQGPLSVKGTSIVGYNEAASVAKTLRKPADQLKEFAKAGKVALRTFLKDIKATETLLNGRISADVLLLKVE